MYNHDDDDDDGHDTVDDTGDDDDDEFSSVGVMLRLPSMHFIHRMKTQLVSNRLFVCLPVSVSQSHRVIKKHFYTALWSVPVPVSLFCAVDSEL